MFLIWFFFQESISECNLGWISRKTYRRNFFNSEHSCKQNYWDTSNEFSRETAGAIGERTLFTAGILNEGRRNSKETPNENSQMN